MNKSNRLAVSLNPQAIPFQLRACSFHCTPVSERRRRAHWDYGSSSGSSSRKFNEYRKRHMKRTLLRNVSEFADNIFQRVQPTAGEYIQPPDRGENSWFRPIFTEDAYNKKGWSGNRNPRRPFVFCDDYVDVEFETIFRSTFGETQGFYRSFTEDAETRYRSSSKHSNSNSRTSSSWKYEYGEEYDDPSSDYSENKPKSDLVTSHRLALGLSQSGPLHIDDVKNAYRACAFKWHPDRHQGSSKVVAEERFKVCSAAYESLCDKLG